MSALNCIVAKVLIFWEKKQGESRLRYSKCRLWMVELVITKHSTKRLLHSTLYIHICRSKTCRSNCSTPSLVNRARRELSQLSWLDLQIEDLPSSFRLQMQSIAHPISEEKPTFAPSCVGKFSVQICRSSNITILSFSPIVGSNNVVDASIFSGSKHDCIWFCFVTHFHGDVS